MKKPPVIIKPGFIVGQCGTRVVRTTINGGVWHTRYDEGGRIVGLELISGKEHWWLDAEINRPDLQREDWDFSPIKDSLQEWQLPWAWKYECEREWQPWSDFDRWREDWRKETERYCDPATDWICGKRTREEAERDAASSYGGRLPLWLLRGFGDYFPHTPWLNIPYEKRKELEVAAQPEILPISLEGSLLDLKEDVPETTGSPFDGEYLARYRQWMDGPGSYQDENVKEIAPGRFVGTYVIEILWNHPDTDLKDAFLAWLKKHAPKRGDLVQVHDQKGYRTEPTTHDRETQEMTGKQKPFARLKQLSALRLWREMKAEAAVGPTMPYMHKSSLLEAKRNADLNLASFFGRT